MRKILSLGMLIMVLLTACEVTEGEGGLSSIGGVIKELQYNDDYSILVDTVTAMDKNVYIVYGDERAVGDQVETGPDGYFEFPYLYEGNYTIYYYSDDKQHPGDEIAIEYEVVLGDKEDTDLGDLLCYEHLDFDDGRAIVTGRVYEVFYNKEDTVMATEKEVYLTYGDHLFYDERIRTQEDGSFYFQNLIPGEYKIVVYGEDVQGSNQQVASARTLTITDNAETTYTVEDFFIANL